MAATARHVTGSSRISLTFFALALAVCGVAAGLCLELMTRLGRSADRGRIFFPAAFLASTCLLFAGSITLHLALKAVRQERQRTFRRWLLAALACASLFMGTQLYGLWSMFPAERKAEDASLEVLSFVFALTSLHAVHFFVASLFVCFVTARTTLSRYDHEYYWGVKVCAWFWDALGIVWLAILGIFTIVIQ
ncbi:cytochrome c oxidase subunit 3 [Planctomicrobium sp. SH661]|uniref:cytochrome c oxidase subunit 3 n=1 Tax=Planctomicrobium sp. SH661 TaxID=3448124 RepID=UPI003F5BE37F